MWIILLGSTKIGRRVEAPSMRISKKLIPEPKTEYEGGEGAASYSDLGGGGELIGFSGRRALPGRALHLSTLSLKFLSWGGELFLEELSTQRSSTPRIIYLQIWEPLLFSLSSTPGPSTLHSDIFNPGELSIWAASSSWKSSPPKGLQSDLQSGELPLKLPSKSFHL